MHTSPSLHCIVPKQASPKLPFRHRPSTQKEASVPQSVESSHGSLWAPDQHWAAAQCSASEHSPSSRHGSPNTPDWQPLGPQNGLTGAQASDVRHGSPRLPFWQPVGPQRNGSRQFDDSSHRSPIAPSLQPLGPQTRSNRQWSAVVHASPSRPPWHAPVGPHTQSQWVSSVQGSPVTPSWQTVGPHK